MQAPGSLGLPYETHYVSPEVGSPVHPTDSTIRRASCGQRHGRVWRRNHFRNFSLPKPRSAVSLSVCTSTKPIRILFRRSSTTRACDSSRIRRASSTQSCTYFVTMTVGGSCLWVAATSRMQRSRLNTEATRSFRTPTRRRYRPEVGASDYQCCWNDVASVFTQSELDEYRKMWTTQKPKVESLSGQYGGKKAQRSHFTRCLSPR